MTKKELQLGVGDSKKPASWAFSEDIVENFDDHIQRSVPRYKDCHKLAVWLSDFYLTQDNDVFVDLGSTTGSLVDKLASHHSGRNKLDITGIEIEPHFVDFSKKRNAKHQNQHKIEILTADLKSYEFTPNSANYISSLFTLQFIKPNNRAEILKNIYDTLVWGGAFIYFEKVRGADARFQDILNYLLNLEKSDQNFNSEEIHGKTMSLVGKMEPFSHKGNLSLLKQAGFSDIEVIFKFINFQGYLCIK